MLTITSTIQRIGYDGDTIRTFSFTAEVTHSDYPGVTTGFGGEPLVSLPRGTDLSEYVQMQFTHDQAFVAHMTNALEFEFIKAGLTVESAQLSPEELRAQMQPLEKWRFDTIIDSRPGLRDKIESAIDRNISDLLQRVTVRNKFRSVTQFSRLDPMFPFLASDPDINISDLEIDEMWRQGLALT